MVEMTGSGPAQTALAALIGRMPTGGRLAASPFVCRTQPVSPRITYMMPKKTIREREKELQTLLGNPAGRMELQELESRYRRANGTSKPQRGSVITYILVQERERGLISSSS
jgi:hypothetical protein